MVMDNDRLTISTTQKKKKKKTSRRKVKFQNKAKILLLRKKFL